MTENLRRRAAALTRTATLGLLLLTPLTVAPDLLAQTDTERAAARAAAQEGAKAFAEGRYDDAVDLFERAEAIMHAPTLLLHLARAHGKLGHFVKARELYIKVTLEPLSADAPVHFHQAKESAERELPDVSAKIARLAIRVSGPSAGIELRMDDRELPPGILGVPYPVDPGPHRIEARAPGFEASDQSVELTSGQSSEVKLELRPVGSGGSTASQGSEPVADAGASSPQADDADGFRLPPPLRLGAYAGFGLGAAALITGTVFLIQRKGLADDADREYQSCAGANSGSCTDPNWQRFIDELDQDASNKKTLAIVSMSASALFVAAGVVLYVTSEPDDASAARIVPYLTPLGGGLRGRF